MEGQVVTASQLNDFTEPKKQTNNSKQLDIPGILKEANSFITNLKGLFVMGEKYREMTEEGDGLKPGNAGAKFEKGVEAGRRQATPQAPQKNMNVALVVDKVGATEKMNEFMETLMAGAKDEMSVKDLKIELKKQMAENKEFIEPMVEDFIRTYASAVEV